MPHTDLDDVESALGTVCLAADRIQAAQTPKLDSVKPGSIESYYMLAAFCFDAARKMEYLFKAFRPFGEHANPELAREIKGHNDHIYAPNLSWEERARRTEAIMRQLYEQIGREHDELLTRVAGTR